MNTPLKQLTAIVLAGQRSAEDPLVQHTGASCKALVEIDGKPTLLRVLDTLKQSPTISKILLSGPTKRQMEGCAPLKSLCDRDSNLNWSESKATPSTSAYSRMQAIPLQHPILITSADHPFLTVEMVETFCQQSLEAKADVTVGLAPYSLVHEAFPDMKKTVMRFSDGEYCGCNLFTFLTPQGRRAADHWRAVESARKSPLKVISILGWFPLLRYRLGWLSLESALELLSKRFDMKIKAVIMQQGEAAVDVDSVADYEIVQREFPLLRPQATMAKAESL